MSTYRQRIGVVGPYSCSLNCLWNDKLKFGGTFKAGPSAADQPIFNWYQCRTHALSTTLRHQQNHSNLSRLTTIKYWGRILNHLQQNYLETKRECLTKVRSIQSPRPYVEGTSIILLMEHKVVSRMLTCNNPNETLISFRLRLCEFNNEDIFRPRPIHHIPDILWRQLYPSDSPVGKPMNVKNPMLESSPTALEQPQNEKGVRCSAFLEKSLRMSMFLHDLTHREPETCFW